jgi:hypothetical protein
VITARRQRGYLLLIAAVIIMVAAAMAGVIVTLSSGSAQGGGAHVQSTQAFFVSESGLEFEQRRLAQNVDWYRSSTDPFDASTNSAGPGSYTVSVNLPATELRTLMTTGSMTSNVFGGGTANRWPSSGTLLIDDFTGDPEFVTYSATGATTFTLTGRNVTVGTVQGALSTHSRGDPVYPVTTLGVALVANCATVPSPFTVANIVKLLDYGTITVFHDNAGTVVSEQLSYAGYSVAGGTRTLLGVQRCQNGTVAIAASSGDPVTPLVTNVGNNDFEVLVNASAGVNSTQRREYKVVQR